MSQIIVRRERGELLAVEPRVEFGIRKARAEDFGWIDAMQKAEADKLGFLMESAIRNRIEAGQVLVARDTGGEDSTPVGYCMFSDRYMHQGGVGVIYQLNIKPEWRRSLVGAKLVEAVLDRAAYGTKLYGLWCRQDLAANEFWEALGFMPIAFRAAGESRQKKGVDPRRRIHIYWQRRVRLGDDQTAYWYPHETQGGLMAESRLVLPMPLDRHWSDPMPMVMPGPMPGVEERAAEVRQIEAEGAARVDEAKEVLKAKRREAREAAKRAAEVAAGPRMVHGVEVDAKRAASVPMGFELPPEVKAAKEARAKAAAAEAERERVKEEKREAKRAAKAARRKSEPKMVDFSRELRDRWQEQVGTGTVLLEAGEGGEGKYEVGRLLEGEGGGGEIAASTNRGRRALDVLPEAEGVEGVRRLEVDRAA